MKKKTKTSVPNTSGQIKKRPKRTRGRGQHSAPAEASKKAATRKGTKKTRKRKKSEDSLFDDAAKQYVARTGRLFSREDWFAKDAGGRLYYYNNGVYIPEGNERIRTKAKDLCSRETSPRGWSSHLANEVVAYVATDAPKLLECPWPNVVNLANGLLDVELNELSRHEGEYLCTVQLPVKFDSSAKCPQWEQFVRDVFPEDSQDLAWEIVAWPMTTARGHQKALLLLGSGANGKSTFLKGLMAFLGRSNVCTLSLQKLEENRFASTRLIGKLACICSDLPNRKLKTVEVFKAVTGGDPLMGEYKFGDSFDVRPFAKLVFAANDLPRSSDSSDGWYRRFYIIPFTKSFEDNPEAGRKLDGVLASPTELSGVLNKALAVLPDVRRRGLTLTPSMEQALVEFRQLTDPLATWLETETVNDPEGFVPKAVLYEAYRRDSVGVGCPPQTQQAFGRALKKLRPLVREGQKAIDGKPVWVHVGIRFHETSLHRV